MNDKDEAPNDAAVLVAPVGKGTYVYTTLSFFRQLPAGNPGAARLFINLLSADPRAANRPEVPARRTGAPVSADPRPAPRFRTTLLMRDGRAGGHARSALDPAAAVQRLTRLACIGGRRAPRAHACTR